MRSTTPTRTLNPLHFEDLEPHRFEDMVRQLVYDFRNWSSLEAVGRLGADEGIDILGTEPMVSASAVDVLEAVQDEEGETDAEEDVISSPATSDRRVWQFQCKRERKMNPAKVRAIIQNDLSQQETKPYAYVLVAACDFSKAARDAFRAAVAPFGVQEFYLWGKAELEDMLVQPKNDPILFAYFGISLQVRRRSLKTDITSKLALKRKLFKVLGGVDGSNYTNILIRDPKSEGYPYIQPSEMASFLKNPRWRYWEFDGHEPPYSLGFLVSRLYAYADWETRKWDVISNSGSVFPLHPKIWGISYPDHAKLVNPNPYSQEHFHWWDEKVSGENKAYLYVIGMISYERIVAIDELGDVFNEAPHLLVDYTPENEPFDRYIYLLRSPPMYRSASMYPKDQNRIEFFPKVFPPESEYPSSNTLP